MANILVVHDDPSPSADDTNLINFLGGRGHSVATASETQSLPNSGYDVIIVTESGSSNSTAIQSIPTCSLPVMIFETTWNTARISTAATTTIAQGGNLWDLTGHSVNTGYSDPLQVWAVGRSFYGTAAANLPAGVTVLAYAPSTTHAVAVFAESGATLTTGTAPNRRCGIGLISSRLSDICNTAGDWFEDVILLTAGNTGGTGATVNATTISRTVSVPNRTPTAANPSIQFKWGSTSYSSEAFPTATTFFVPKGTLANGDYVMFWVNSPESITPSSVSSGFGLVQTWNNTHGYLLLYHKYITNAAGEPSSWEVTFPQAVRGGIIALCYSGVDSTGWGSYSANIDSAGNNTFMTAPNVSGAGGPQQMVVHCGITNDHPFDFGTQVSSTSTANVPSGAGTLNARTQITGNDSGNGQGYSSFTYDRNLLAATAGSGTGSLTMNYLSSLASIAVTITLKPAVLDAPISPSTINRSASFGLARVSPLRVPLSTTFTATTYIPTPAIGIAPAKDLPAHIGAVDSNVEAESHSYNPVIVDGNGNLYTITESTLATNNQPRAMKSADGGETWTEMDAANRPGTDVAGIGDLESGWITYDPEGYMAFSWQRSYTVWVRFRTSDHPTNPDTWETNTRNQVIAASGTPQFASHVNPNGQAYSWVFAPTSSGTIVYTAVNKATGVEGSTLTLDSATTCTAPMAYFNPNSGTFVLYKKNSQLHFKKLTLSGVLDSASTRVDTNGVNAVAIPHARPVTYTVNTQEVVTCIFTNSSGHLKAVDVINGVPGSEQTITTSPVLHNPGDSANDGAIVSADVVDTKLYAFWTDNATGDILYSTREYGGVWSTPTAIPNQPATGAWWLYVKTNEYPDNKRVISIRYSDGFDSVGEVNDIYYDELPVAPSGGQSAGTAVGTITRSVFFPPPTVVTSGVPAATINRTASFPSRTLAAGALVLASSIAVTSSVGGFIPAPGGTNAAPATVSRSVSFAPYTITLAGPWSGTQAVTTPSGTTAVPQTISRKVNLGTYTISLIGPWTGVTQVTTPAGAATIPGTISRTVSIPTPVAGVGLGLVVAPNSIVRIVTISTPTARVGSAATPATVFGFVKVTVMETDWALNAEADIYELDPVIVERPIASIEQTTTKADIANTVAKSDILGNVNQALISPDVVNGQADIFNPTVAADIET